MVFHRLWTSRDAEMGAHASRASATGANAVVACPPPKPPKPPPGANAPMEGAAPPHAKLNNECASRGASSSGCGVMYRTSFWPHRTLRAGCCAAAAWAEAPPQVQVAGRHGCCLLLLLVLVMGRHLQRLEILLRLVLCLCWLVVLLGWCAVFECGKVHCVW